MSSEKAKLVRIAVERGETGLLYATSSQVSGLFVTARSDAELREEVVTGIKALYDHMGKTVDVHWVDDDNDDSETWPLVTIPAHIAGAAMG